MLWLQVLHYKCYSHKNLSLIETGPFTSLFIWIYLWDTAQQHSWQWNHFYTHFITLSTMCFQYLFWYKQKSNCFTSKKLFNDLLTWKCMIHNSFCSEHSSALEFCNKQWKITLVVVITYSFFHKWWLVRNMQKQHHIDRYTATVFCQHFF